MTVRGRSLPAVAALAMGGSGAGCAGVQSALDPAGVAAQEIAALWWAMAGGATVIFALVLLLLLHAALAKGGRRRISAERLILAGGIALPVVVLSILVPFNVRVARGVTAASSPDTLTVRVNARQWWWRVEYDDGTPAGSFETANEIYLPVGEPVEVLLTSADVIHSFWLPNLAGKLDAIPGRTNRLLIQADRAGVYRGQCAEFCGVAHTKMALYAVALPPEEFAAWMTRQRAAARPPQDELSRAGAEAFRSSGCLLCHAVRGHGAWARTGPDLTHVGSRLTIGAGLLPTTGDNVALWIARNDALKHGNRMPDFADLPSDTLALLGAYLASLQ